jgi:hypothetical protein
MCKLAWKEKRFEKDQTLPGFLWEILIVISQDKGSDVCKWFLRLMNIKKDKQSFKSASVVGVLEAEHKLQTKKPADCRENWEIVVPLIRGLTTLGRGAVLCIEGSEMVDFVVVPADSLPLMQGDITSNIQVQIATATDLVEIANRREGNRSRTAEEETEDHKCVVPGSAVLLKGGQCVIGVKVLVESQHGIDCLKKQLKINEKNITILNHAFKSIRVFPQRFYKNTLHGPDIRRLLNNLDTFFLKLEKMLIEENDIHEQWAQNLTNKHKPLLESMKIINEFSRKTDRLLTFPEVATLSAECKNYGELFRGLYKRPLTPKVHMIERHYPLIAEMYRTIGFFSSEGTESAHHPQWNKAAKICASIVDPAKRMTSTRRRFELQQKGVAIDRTIHQRSTQVQPQVQPRIRIL